MFKKIQKIYIVGSSGSGKTFLANFLADKMNYPHYDMDDVRFLPTKQVLPMEERINIIQNFIYSPQWIAEGVYVAWTKSLLEQADQIIWLDLPLRVTFPRILKRFIIQKITRKDRYGLKKFLKLVRFLIRHHYPDPKFENSEEDGHITKEKIKKALLSHTNKVIILKNVQEIEKFRQELGRE